MQHQPGKEFKTLASFLDPLPRRTIEICDSPYHILATNVNTLPLRVPGSRPAFPAERASPTHTPAANSASGHADSLQFSIEIISFLDLWDNQHEPARDLSASQLLECFIGFGQRARAYSAVDFPRCSQRENLAHIFPRTHGTRLDANLRGRH
jgi:hypothetical protein